MSIPYIQSTMASVRAGEGSAITYPFLDEGDAATKVYTMDCSQTIADYDSAQIDLDDTMSSAASAGVIALPFTADAAAYFIGDSGHSVSNGMVSFQRKFANIPSASYEFTGSRSYSFPGWTGSNITTENLFTIRAAAHTYPSNIITLTSLTNNNINLTDVVAVRLEYTISGSSIVHFISGNFEVIAVPSATTITVDIGRIFPSQKTLTVVSGEGAAVNVSRPTISVNSPTITETTYVLPGVTPGITTVSDISLPPVFSITDLSDADGLMQTAIKTLDSTTIPTVLQYRAMIEDKTNIIVEASISKWMGNILMQEVQTVRAL